MDAIQKTLTETGDLFVAWLEAAGPKLLSAVVILVLGWTVAKLARSAITKALTVIKLDTLADKAGINAFLKRGNIESTSVGVIGSLTYWLLLLLTLLVTVKSLGIDEAELGPYLRQCIQRLCSRKPQSEYLGEACMVRRSCRCQAGGQE